MIVYPKIKTARITIKTIYLFLFFLGVFFLPFNSDPPAMISFMGEYSRESCSLFFLLGSIFLLLDLMMKRKIPIPFFTPPYLIFVIFFCYLFIGVFFNLYNIFDYYFKHTSGLNRFIKQIISIFLIGVLFIYLFYSVIKTLGIENAFLKIRRVMLWSLWFVGVYAFFEFIIITFNTNQSNPILAAFDYLPFVKSRTDFSNGRIQSLTYEPPALGTYLITISGFMFSYIFSGKSIKKFIPFLVVIILALISKSRTAFVIIFVQTAFGVFISYKYYPFFRKWVHHILILGVFLFIVFFSFKSELIINSVGERLDSLNFIENTNNSVSINAVSNKSRMGIQYANFLVFLKHPFFGIGWGQQAFEAKSLYPKWATTRNYEFTMKYLNEDHLPFPPGYNLYLRIMAETGLIGMVLFLTFLVTLILTAWKFLKVVNHKYRFIYIAIIIGLIGSLLNWFQIDSFRTYGFWLCFVFLMVKLPNNFKQVG